MPNQIVWSKNSGRNGWDSVLEVGDGQSVEALNVTFYQSGLGTKRGGAKNVTVSGATQPINATIEYVPGQDPTVAELFLVDSATPTAILRGNTGTSSTDLTLTALTLKDAVSSEPQNVSSAVLNGKLYLAYDSTVNRLHVYDPGLSTTQVRRAGLATPAAPTASDTGVGTYASIRRYYRVAYTEQRGGVTVRRSELSPSSGQVTPGVGGAAEQVTKPAAINEGETHWEVYGAAADPTTGLESTYYLLATTVVGTTTYNDTAAPADYADNDAAPAFGANTPFPSVKYLGTTGERLYGLGVWETAAGDSLTPRNGRLYFGPVLDSSEVHDDERINNTTTLEGWINLTRNAGSVDRGVTPRPVNNVIYAFQSVGVFGFIPTESDRAPYRRLDISNVIGAVNQASIVVAQDRNGGTAAYFLDPVLGPFTVGGRYGLRWCGKDVKDVWDTFNKDAAHISAFSLWHPDRTLVLFWIATDTSDDPDTVLALDVTEQTVDEAGDLRGGWAVWDGAYASARCGAMFSNTVAATRSRVRVPYIGRGSSSALLRYDESVQHDAGTAFQAYVTSGTLVQGTHLVELERSYLRASAETGTTIQQTLIRNAGDETSRVSTVNLTPVGGETIVLRKFEDAALQEADSLQVTLGDSDAVISEAWTLYGWFADTKTGGPR